MSHILLASSRQQMRRIILAAGIVTTTLIPALVATVWLFGCCVLPFHRAIHRLVPLCRIAIAMAHNGDHSDQQPSTTAQGKQRPPQRMATELTANIAVQFRPRSSPLISFTPAAYRSFITLGALRCDCDVGLHMLFATFLV